MMQVQLAAVHPSPLQHGCWLLQTSKGAFAAQGSSCILTVGHNLFTCILQEKKGLQDRETSTQLTMLCQKSAHLQSMHPCVESQQMPTPQGKSEVVFCRGLGMMTKQSVGLPSEIFAHAQDHSTETSTSSSFIMWASVEILLALSITAP